jgi:hypothetical protein
MANIRKMENVRRLADVVGFELDLGDEHSRFAFYKSIADEPRWRLALLSCLLVETNTDVSTSVVLALLEKVAPWERDVVVHVAPASDQDRVTGRASDLALLELLLGRSVADEGLGSGGDVILTSLIDGSDWLQRRVADEAVAMPVLTLLAERGRTKKVRARAVERSRPTTADG